MTRPGPALPRRASDALPRQAPTTRAAASRYDTAPKGGSEFGSWTITATLTSGQHRPHAGWYRQPVTVTFTCQPGSAPLTSPCPAPVTSPPTATITSKAPSPPATPDTTASVSPFRVTVNVDHTGPRLHISCVRRGHTYLGAGPTRLRCLAHDALPGVRGCHVHRHRHGTTITYLAIARDQAGNVTRHRGHYRVLPAHVAGVRLRHGRFLLHAGHTYTLVAALHTAQLPLYLQAAPAGQQPHPAAPSATEQARPVAVPLHHHLRDDALSALGDRGTRPRSALAGPHHSHPIPRFVECSPVANVGPLTAHTRRRNAATATCPGLRALPLRPRRSRGPTGPNTPG